MTFTIKHLIEKARSRPAGYIADVLASAGITTPIAELDPSSIIDLPSAVYDALCAKYRPAVPPLLELAMHYDQAIAPWRSAGYPVLEASAACVRADICGCCEEFRLREGKLTCRAYGCEPLKFWLAPAPCVLGKWPL